MKGVWEKFDVNNHNIQDGETVLCILNNTKYWLPLVYNEYHQCFDDSSMDDYYCNLENVKYIFKVPSCEIED